MTTINSLNFPNNPVLLHFKGELQKNPANFDRKEKLYYIAAVISGIVAAVFFLSFIVLQTKTLPFWSAIAGTAATQIAGGLFIKITNEMIQNAQEMEKSACCLREMQNTYKNYQEVYSYEPEKIIRTYVAFAEKEYVKAEQNLKELTQDILKSKANPVSGIERFIQLQHQALLLKIDLSFKSAVLRAVMTDNISYLEEQDDLLMISNQDPLKRNRIQGLNDILKEKITEPLVSHTKTFDFFRFENLAYEEIEEMPPDKLTNHIFEVMISPSSYLFSELT